MEPSIKFKSLKWTLLTFATVVFYFKYAMALTSGPNQGRTFTNVPIVGSKSVWVNAANAENSDNLYATIVANSLSSSEDYTDYLQITNFGFAIPTGAIINGIIVEIERGDINNAKDNRVRIVKDGTIGSTDQSLNPAWSSESYVSYGGPTELWGETWSEINLNNSNFGIAFSCKKQGGGANPLPVVDHVRITIQYINNLPIELLYFTANKLLSNDVSFEWKTATELNNDYFTIEHSSNGIDFQYLGQIAGNGTSSVPKSYSFYQKDAPLGINYYRLKQTDYNGSFEYLKTISIENNVETEDGIYNLFENKNGQLILETFSNREANFNLVVYNNAGQLIYIQKVLLQQGFNIVSIENLSFQNGIYYFKFFNNSSSFFKKWLSINQSI